MKALDLMTYKPVTVRADESVLAAVKLMLDRNVSGLPVLDDGGQLVGMITEGDLIRRAELATEKRRSWWRSQLTGPGKLAEEYTHTHGHRVRDVMTSPVISVDFGATAEEIVDVMERHHVKRIPVLRGTTLVGIVSRRDFLRIGYWLIVDPAGAQQPIISDDAIASQLAKDLRQPSWTHNIRVEPRVHDGIVELFGVVGVHDNLFRIDPYSGFVMAPPNADE